MAKDKMTIEQVRDKVEVEGGLGMTIEEYMSGDSIADPKLAELWDEARKAIEAVETYIAEHAEDEQEEPGQDPAEVVKADGEILCESAPTIFDDVTKTDDYGLAQIDADAGGTVRLNLAGGRFGNLPEVYFRGEFGRGELRDFMVLIAPHIRTDRGQSVRVKAPGADHWSYESFPTN